jgi:translation initiation factor 3 subunit A
MFSLESMYHLLHNPVDYSLFCILVNMWCFLTPEAERKKKEQLERQAKLDEILEKQRQREREIEEKAEREKREALLGRPAEPALRPYEPPARPLESGAAPAAAAAATAAPGKYVPKFRRGGADTTRAPPPEADRWGNSGSKPDGDRWDRNSSFGSGGGSRSSSTWSSSRVSRDRQ